MQSASSKSFSSLIDYIEGFFVTVIFRIIFGLALFFFLWNVYQFIKNAGNPEERKKRRAAMLWSIVALAAMFSVWALVSIVTGSFGEPTVLPQIDSQYLDSFR